MSDVKIFDENQLFDMYDYLLQKEKELQSAKLKSSPEGLNLGHEEEQLKMLKELLRSEIKDLISKETLTGKELGKREKILK
ncbi:MAG: hypothetical protein I3I94_08190 [Acidaminococcaceae bacterium]|jgi:hypothetical protein|nr:hypothetical protein [Acidaminococcaceae bacterium]MCI2098440.1 hypothetical protein [Succiniclasticum sp.]MDY6302775.1 hypothetical protein [Succiniclasticum sp.]HCJ90497.1 hypothetical protein [Acidaminococcaceae bacterium]